jgi:SAM-dependent methyltransferase
MILDAEPDVTNQGERASDSLHDWNYYAHLSIYHFALQFITDRTVLDAGSGSGYGTNYLATNGKAKSVEGCDGSASAIAHCNSVYPNVRYASVDLCSRLPYDDCTFDVIFSSNVMEHLVDIDHFLNECRRILRLDGTMIIAVPPIASRDLLRANIKNPFHITNLTPRGWHAKIGRFFDQVQPRLHRPGGRFASSVMFEPELTKSPAEIQIRQADFDFPETDIDDLNTQAHNMTAVFIVSSPRISVRPPSAAEDLPRDWYHGALVGEIIAEEREHFERIIASLRAELDQPANRQSL